jgi:hypothetical protein
LCGFTDNIMSPFLCLVSTFMQEIYKASSIEMPNLSVEPHFLVAQNENTNDKEIKPKEVATTDGGNNKSTRQPEVENVTNIHERAASMEEKQSVPEIGDLVGGGEKVVSKEVKPAKDEVIDKDLLQVILVFL